MGGYYIGIHLKTTDAAGVKNALAQTFTDAGFRLLGDEPLSAVLDDEDRLPSGDAWYGAIATGPAGRGWVSVYVDDWADSGLLAKSVSRALGVPALEVWVADDIHWGYTYYEAGEVADRFADDPGEVAETPAEAALYRGNAEVLSAVLQAPAGQLAKSLTQARAQAGQFAGGPLGELADSGGLPFEHVFTGYDYFFSDDPDDYSGDLEHWPLFRHLAFQPPPGRETLAE